MRHDTAALSEIVGALMLVLVVASASTGIALFVQQEQKQTNAQKQLELDRELEVLGFSHLVPQLNATQSLQDRWGNFSVTVSSLHLKESTILGLSINGEQVENYNLTRFNRTSELWEDEWLNHTSMPEIAARENVTLFFYLPNATFSGEVVLVTDAITLEILTGRTNTYSVSFVPPTAVALPRVESARNQTGEYNHTVMLDGSLSDHPEGAGRIVRWTWTIDNDGDGVIDETILGRIARGFQCDGVERDIFLEVTDRNGMVGRDEILDHTC